MPITVWEHDYGDAMTRAISALIGDEGAERDGVFKIKGGRTSFVPEQKHGASIFSPALAAWPLNFWGPEDGVVFDPFAGGGTRAVMTAAKGLRYVGIELRESEARATRARADALGFGDRVSILRGDSRDAARLLRPRSADFLLTCPPYWNLEVYDGGPRDLSTTKTYEDFLDGLYEVVRATFEVLRPGSLSVWVVGMFRAAGKHADLVPLHHDVTRLHVRAGFALKEEVVVYKKQTGALTRIHIFEKGNRFLVRVHEYALVFRRP